MIHRNSLRHFLITILLLSFCVPVSSYAHPCDDKQRAIAKKPYRELVFNTIINPYLINGHTLFLDKLFNPLFAELRKHTKGSIEPKYYLPFELGPITEIYSSVVSGEVDMGFSILMDSDQENFPVTTLLRFPRVDKFTYQPALVTWRMLQEFPEMKREWQSVKVLFLYGENNGGIATTSKPIQTLADIKGLRLLSINSWAAKQAEALGAIAVLENRSIDAMLERLKTGDVDGMVYDLPGFLIDYGFVKYITHTIDLRLSPSSLYTVMNLGVWHSLSKQEQKAINTVFDKDAYVLADNAMKEMDASYRERLDKEFGVIRSQMPAIEKAKAAKILQPMRDQYAEFLESKGINGKDLMQRFDRLYEEYAE